MPVITSRTTSLLSEIDSKSPIPKEKLAFFQTRLQLRLYDLVVSKFREKAKADGLTKAELARRIGRRPEIITRLLGAPGNFRLDTISDLLLGIAGEELDTSATQVSTKAVRNSGLPDWVSRVPKGNEIKPSDGLSRYMRSEKRELQLGIRG